jgi:hypothetical protein
MTCQQKPTCRIWRLLRLAISALIVSAVSLQSLTADDQPAARPDDAEALLTVSGVVRDAFVGRPISGAKVTVYQEIGKGEGQKSVKRFELTTEADGCYKFQCRTDDPNNVPEAMQGYDSPIFSFRTVVRHTDYMPASDWSNVPVQLRAAFDASNGFAHRTASDDPARRQLSTLELRPGKSITGIIQDSYGKPLAGVKIVAHSRAPDIHDIRIRGDVTISPDPPVIDEAATDSGGRFQATMITPGIGMLSIEPDKDFAPFKQVVFDQRGDVGTIKLQRGAVIRGKLIDVDGKPQLAVQVTAYPWNRAEPQISDHNSGQSIDEEIHAAALTDAAGNFTLARLPMGDYRVEPVAYSDSKQKVNENGQFYNEFHPVPGIFVPQRLRLVDGQDPSAIELRAVPIVTIAGRVSIDTNPQGAAGDQLGGGFRGADVNLQAAAAAQLAQFGRGRGGPGAAASRVMFGNQGLTVQGTFAGLPFRAPIQWNFAEGTFKADVPKGMSDTMIQIDSERQVGRGGFSSLANTRVQWRLGQDAPLQSTSKIRLGTIGKDFSDLEIVLVRGSPPRTAEALKQQLEAEVAAGRMTPEQAAALQQVFERQLDGLGPDVAGQAVGRGRAQAAAQAGGRAAGRAPAAARGGRARAGAAQPTQQPAEDNNDDAGK